MANSILFYSKFHFMSILAALSAFELIVNLFEDKILTVGANHGMKRRAELTRKSTKISLHSALLPF